MFFKKVVASNTHIHKLLETLESDAVQ